MKSKKHMAVITQNIVMKSKTYLIIHQKLTEFHLNG